MSENPGTLLKFLGHFLGYSRLLVTTLIFAIWVSTILFFGNRHD